MEMMIFIQIITFSVKRYYRVFFRFMGMLFNVIF